jgi:ABC-2 type transport system permease protein
MRMSHNDNAHNPLHGIWALTNRELKKWYKNPFVFIVTMIQPIIWMGLFGKAFNLGALFVGVPVTLPSGLPPQLQTTIRQSISDLMKQMFNNTFGTSDYFSFMAIGMLAFIALFTTMSSGMSIVWDRRLGFLNKVLSTPVARGSILMSKVFAAVIRTIVQAAIVLVFALVLGLVPGPDFNALSLLGAFGALFLLSIGLSSIFIFIAIRSTKWETQMAVMNLVNLPLLFGSNALFPTSLMPAWLQMVTRVNPITYANDATRQLILYPIVMQRLLIDFAYLGAFAIISSSIGIMLSWKYLSK